LSGTKRNPGAAFRLSIATPVISFSRKLLSPWKVPWQAAVIFFNVIFFIGNTSFQIVT